MSVWDEAIEDTRKNERERKERKKKKRNDTDAFKQRLSPNWKKYVAQVRQI